MDEATERIHCLQEEQAAMADKFHAERMQPLEEESVALEAEVHRLQARSRELRRGLDDISHQLDACRVRQRSAMTQSDSWRTDLEGVRSTSAQSKLEVAAQAEFVQMKRAGCSDFSDAIQRLQAGLQEALSEVDGEMDAALNQACEDVSASASGAQGAADAWVADAAAALQRWRVEDARAVHTLELMGVDNAEGELPTRRQLPGLLAALRGAWQERLAAGGVEAAQRSEVEGLLSLLAPLEQGGRPEVPPSPAALPLQEPAPAAERARRPALSVDLGPETPLTSPLASPAASAGAGGRPPGSPAGPTAISGAE